MEAPKQTKKDAITITVIGLLISVLGATLPIEIGGGVLLTNKEAWEQGIAPTMLGFGLLLVCFSFFLVRGAPWVKWPMILWLPVFFLAETIVVWDVSKTTYTEFLFLGVPVLLIWFWIIHFIFKRDETIEYLSTKQ